MKARESLLPDERGMHFSPRGWTRTNGCSINNGVPYRSGTLGCFGREQCYVPAFAKPALSRPVKLSKIKEAEASLDREAGFEPALMGPEPIVLPLDDSRMSWWTFKIPLLTTELPTHTILNFQFSQSADTPLLSLSARGADRSLPFELIPLGTQLDCGASRNRTAKAHDRRVVYGHARAPAQRSESFTLQTPKAASDSTRGGFQQRKTA